jgi:hypothetical protein
MSKRSIVVVFTVLICSLLFAGCGNKSDEEALKWKTEYDKMYVINENLKGQLEGQKQMLEELKLRIERDQQTIQTLQKELQSKN